MSRLPSSGRDLLAAKIVEGRKIVGSTKYKNNCRSGSCISEIDGGWRDPARLSEQTESRQALCRSVDDDLIV